MKNPLILIVFILISLQLSSCSHSLNTSMSKLSYVDTLVANISVNKSEVKYIMRYQMTENSPDKLYAKIRYQDFADSNLIHSTPIGLLAQIKVINFKSMASSSISNRQYFEITLELYQDADYNKAVGQHRDLIWFELPDNVAEILQITLL